MDTIKLNFRGFGEKECQRGKTYYEIVKDFKTDDDIFACKINGEIVSLTEKAIYSEDVELVYKNSFEGRVLYKSAVKFIFLTAFKNLFKNSEVYYEHSVPVGIFASLKVDKMLTNTDISNIFEEMNRIVKSNELINRKIIRKKEALLLYNKLGELEKANNISNIMDEVFTIFELCGNYNYFFSEMPYSTGGITNFDLVYLGNNKIVIVLPNLDGEKASYVHNDKIINSFDDNQSWLNSQNTPYFEDLNLIVGNGKIKNFMKSNELVFNFEIERVVKEIISKQNVKFVMIAGPSSSGKTTTTKRIAQYLSAMGYNPVCLSTDDYFLNREDTPKNENGDLDFERLDAIDLEHFNNDLTKLLNGETVIPPKFNFISGIKETGEKSVKLNGKSIVLIEGLHSLNDDLTFKLDSTLKYKIYLSPFASISVDRHNYLSTIDLRLIRRIVRDNRTRGYGVATTMHNWQVVRSGEEKYIFPYIQSADTIINTALEFEVGVLKTYIEPLLLSVNIASPYYAEARRLLVFLKQFFPVPGEYVNKDSIIREFIGGLDD